MLSITNPANGSVIAELPEDTHESVHAKFLARRWLPGWRRSGAFATASSRTWSGWPRC